MQISKEFQNKERKHNPFWTKNIFLIDRRGLKCMIWTTEWISVIFSYEKKFNLDDPNGFQYYWHCFKQKEQYYSTSQEREGNLMVALLLVSVVDQV